ncbi:MAG: DUF3110 domain-containing protein [Kastovskya adunca ATA6-11-RM4]|jgi:hypothetical protein|nr:DUF3110 domain-containing protein [Kastovskya adunca ATA6-11-RM4]
MPVFVLLFNARTENEGIHSIQIGDRNKVLMFQSEDDALRFALMLEAQDFPEATVEAFEAEEIEEFCSGAGYDAELIEEGMLAMPPETNLEKTDWKIEQDSDEDDLDLDDPVTKPEISDLDRIRRQLEGLL